MVFGKGEVHAKLGICLGQLTRDCAKGEGKEAETAKKLEKLDAIARLVSVDFANGTMVPGLQAFSGGIWGWLSCVANAEWRMNPLFS